MERAKLLEGGTWITIIVICGGKVDMRHRRSARDAFGFHTTPPYILYKYKMNSTHFLTHSTSNPLETLSHY